MDKVCNATFTVINLLLALLLSTLIWGITPLIAFGIVAAPLVLVALVCVFFEAGFGICPASTLLRACGISGRSK